MKISHFSSASLRIARGSRREVTMEQGHRMRTAANPQQTLKRANGVGGRRELRFFIIKYLVFSRNPFPLHGECVWLFDDKRCIKTNKVKGIL